MEKTHKVNEWKNGNFTLTDDPKRVDVDAVCELLRNTYWASKRPRNIIEKTIAHSICFSLLFEEKQIGFARVVTDYAVFSWIADVVIHPEFRGKGLGKWMTKCILEHPDINDTQQVLQTADAHEFYKNFGFEVHESRFMSRFAKR